MGGRLAILLLLGDFDSEVSPRLAVVDTSSERALVSRPRILEFAERGKAYTSGKKNMKNAQAQRLLACRKPAKDR
jgi:hypothetical protein